MSNSGFTEDELEEMEAFLDVLPNYLNSEEEHLPSLLQRLLFEYKNSREVYVLVHTHQKGMSVMGFGDMEDMQRDAESWVTKNRGDYGVPEDRTAEEVVDNWSEYTDGEEDFHFHPITIKG